MISRLPSNFLFIALLLIVVLTFWKGYMTETLETTVDDGQHHPNYIAEGVSGVQVEYISASHGRFVAKEMLQYDNVTNLETPYFVYTEPDKPIMRLKADRAELFNRGDDIHLIENVMVVRGKDDDKVTLRTGFLHLIPDESIVKTDKMVTIMDKSRTISAVGMLLDNHTGVIQLLSEVKVIDK